LTSAKKWSEPPRKPALQRVEIVFARLIDDAQEALALCHSVAERDVDLPWLE